MIVLKCSRCDSTNLIFIDEESINVQCKECNAIMDIDMECYLDEVDNE